MGTKGDHALKHAVRKIVSIQGEKVTLRIEQELEFDGITLEPKGEAKIVAFVGGQVVDPFKRYGDDAMRKVIAKAVQQ